jgi:hypothetical protein
MSQRAILGSSILASCFAFACGPAPRHNNGDNIHGADANGNCTDENTPATCSDGLDNNCNGLVDCADPSCSGIGNCPVCGMVEHPLGTPFFLPDGVTSGTACTTNAQCTNTVPPAPNCIIFGSPPTGECHASYTSALHFSAFGSTQAMTQVSDIVSVCVNMEHEWIRDLQIELIAPSGQMIRLNAMEGRNGGEVYLGEPYDEDGGGMSGPHIGYDYCWKPTATNAPMLDYANAHVGTLPNYTDASGPHQQLPAGDYQASDPWMMLVGAMLNGDWTLRVTDLWGEDVGYVHKWQIAFNPSIVQNCSGPVIQ